ncbi:hypothetical protein L596_009688 [Steinernema carpocapsae]|uniref:Ubiquitin-like domain-containing protein n=1 Tax=Steinernema carpocapsae TaxID=34508 RepID=A0A4U5PHE0_STECR|nr:hypothetical protein L596_009688 [Steinernema carpocapsae]
MSSSDDEDIFSIEAITKKRKKPKNARKLAVKHGELRAIDLDVISDSEIQLFDDRPKEKKDADSDLSDIELLDVPVVEQIRRKLAAKEKPENLEQQQPRKRLDSFSSEDDEPKPVLEPQPEERTTRSGRRIAKRKSDSLSETKPEKKRRPRREDADIVDLNESVQSVRFEPDLIAEEDFGVLEIRYHVKDFAGANVTSFFYPSDKPINAIQEQFKDKLDASLPYLYFFTDAQEPLNPEKTPIELGWDLNKIAIVRIQQSGVKAFHLAEKKPPKSPEEGAESAESVDDGKILVKFGIKDRHKPFKVKIDPEDTFGKIKAEFCSEQGFDPSKCFFEFDCERLKDDETPTDKELEAGDKIDVHFR